MAMGRRGREQQPTLWVATQQIRAGIVNFHLGGLHLHPTAVESTHTRS